MTRDPAAGRPQSFPYCDVSVPAPLDQSFTYALPETMRHRVRPGCRVLVPFGPRKIAGMVIRVHDGPPGRQVKPALRLLDEEPVLDEELLELGRWIADYYAAPLGETLRAMIPLSGDIRKTKTYELTDQGRQIARQFLLADPGDPAAQVLAALERRPLSDATLRRKIEGFDKAVKTLLRKGLIEAEENRERRDPLRSPSAKLRVELKQKPNEAKLPKAERELVAFLEMHPGSHNLANVEQLVRNAGTAARSLARKGHALLEYERPAVAQAALVLDRHLSAEQATALDAISQGLAGRRFQVFLLHGVTGSGKTEVYLRAIDAMLQENRGSLLLVPEIALTPQVAAQFYQRFGDRVAILHSAFSDTERSEQWRRIREGLAPVVVGTRSGVFAPVRNLGLIVVDEEHDSSYKQDETPRYNGRDVAIVRAQAAGACVVLGSATPSLESRFNAERGKYTLLELPERIARRPLPQVEIIDMRIEFLETRRHSNYSRRLLDAIGRRLESGEQVMLLLNRRGFSSFVVCRACGTRIECANCSVTLTYHRRDRRLLCHYCGYAERVPETCPKCESEHVQFMGSGSEKIEDELHRLFPASRIARLDRDAVSGKRQFETILQDFRDGNYDILVGTQMIAKGHDIPSVTLVGVVSADIGLGMPDFRAAERTFQLLTQVAGRAGRGDAPGQVLIQTVNPDHWAIRLAAAQDYKGFYDTELQFRRQLRYPPFAALANILVRHPEKQEALRMSGQLAMLLTRLPEGVKMLGPAEAHVARLRTEYRYQMLLKAASRKELKNVLKDVIQFARGEKWSPASLVVDVDPVNLL